MPLTVPLTSGALSCYHRHPSERLFSVMRALNSKGSKLGGTMTGPWERITQQV